MPSQSPNTQLTATPLSVTELTARIKQVLESGFSRIEVSGEISRLTRPASGHLYFTIKDAHAAISAVVWRSTAARLAVKPEEGGEYIFSGHLSLYEPRGSYQIVVTRIEPAGAGRLAAEFERRKQLFTERGWFDQARKQAIPALPQHIGIVTSATAAAFEDVKKVLATRPGWLKLTLSQAIVQGSSAPASIASGLTALSSMASPPDVILLVRGGGSIEDLWCFNDERVVKAMADCPIPIISGIGHEIDTTLADLAADLRAATPSNAAECACPSRQELATRLPRASMLEQLLRRQLDHLGRERQSLQQRLHHSSQRQMDARLHAGSRLRSQLEQSALREINRQRTPLRRLEMRLKPLQPDQRLALRQRQWVDLKHDLTVAGRDTLLRMQRKQEQPARRLQSLASTLPQTGRKQLAVLTAQLRELNPGAVLARGYTMSMDSDGRPVTSANALQPGQQIQVRFRDGTAKTRIESIHGETS